LFRYPERFFAGCAFTAGAPFPPGDSVERSAPFECCARFERIRMHSPFN